VNFNPFSHDIIALSCAENFGYAGSGSLFTLRVDLLKRAELMR